MTVPRVRQFADLGELVDGEVGDGLQHVHPELTGEAFGDLDQAGVHEFSDPVERSPPEPGSATAATAPRSAPPLNTPSRRNHPCDSAGSRS